MKNWDLKKLGEVCEFVGGSQPSKTVFSYEKKENNIRLIQIRDYKSDNHIVYIPKNKAKRFCNSTDIMIGRYGPPVFQILKGLEGAYNVALMKAVPNEKVLIKDFAFLFLKYSKIQDYIIHLSQRAAGQTGVNKEAIEDYPILLPPLPEQQRIVAILDEAFASIAKAKANAEQNLKNANELFESYLQGVFEKKEADWEEKTLGDVCTTTQGVQIVKGEQSSELLPNYKRYLYISDFKNEKSLKYVKDIYPNKIVTTDDLIVVNTGNSAGDIFKGIDGILSNNLFKVTYDKNIINSDFIYYFVTSTMFRNYQIGIMRGTANPHMGHENFNSTPFCFPTLREQQTIVQKLDALSAETKKLEAIYQTKINDLEELKKSVLQKAFNGELTSAGDTVSLSNRSVTNKKAGAV